MSAPEPSEFSFQARKENYNIVHVTLEDILNNTLEKAQVDIFETTGELVNLGIPKDLPGSPRFILLYSQWATNGNDNLSNRLSEYVANNIYIYKPKEE